MPITVWSTWIRLCRRKQAAGGEGGRAAHLPGADKAGPPPAAQFVPQSSVSVDCGDLELRKVYQVLPDAKAANDGYLRVVDESGEDYLYPACNFIPISLPVAAPEAMLAIR